LKNCTQDQSHRLRYLTCNKSGLFSRVSRLNLSRGNGYSLLGCFRKALGSNLGRTIATWLRIFIVFSSLSRRMSETLSSQKACR
jgi:hypothetical protein